MKDVIEDVELKVPEVILTHEEKVDLIPSSMELSSVEQSLANAMNRENILKTRLS